MSAPVRLGYVGCGFMAQRVHLPNFASIPGCQLVALAEVRPDLRQAVAGRYGIPRTYASHQEMVADPELDAKAIYERLALRSNLSFCTSPLALQRLQSPFGLNSA